MGLYFVFVRERGGVVLFLHCKYKLPLLQPCCILLHTLGWSGEAAMGAGDPKRMDGSRLSD